MGKLLRDNGLSIVLLLLFLGSLTGQVFAGHAVDNQDRLEHAQAALGLVAYLGSGEFFSALFENWESEFLQMSAFVMLTAYLFQRGSPESKDPDKKAPQDRDPALDRGKPDAPWPVRVGGFVSVIYAHSLGLALMVLFIISFVLHWLNSARHAADEAVQHHLTPPTALQYLGSAELWFESFQNWQSEFLSTAALVILAVFLRERGSPESKPVGAPHSQTGTD